MNHPCNNCHGYPDCINGCLALEAYRMANSKAWFILLAIAKELQCAESLHAPMASKAHALGVIREEYLEFEHEVMAEKTESLNTEMRNELVQLAAMCVRAIKDLEEK